MRKETLTLQGDLTIHAAADESKSPKFTMLAYTGKPINLAYWDYPVVIDIDGIEIRSQRMPIRLQHDVNKGVGHTERITKTQSSLTAEGYISRETPWARDVVLSSKKGFPWQASIGADVLSVVFVPEGEKVMANNQVIEGPVYYIDKSRLAEISFVDLGADEDTAAAVAAAAVKKTENNKINNYSQEQKMAKDQKNNEKPLEAKKDETQEVSQNKDKGKVEAQSQNSDAVEQLRLELAKETERINQVRRICAGRHPDIEAKAIREGWGEDKIKLEVMLADRQTAPNINAPEPVETLGVLEAAAMMSGGLSGDALIKKHGEKIVEAADKRYKGRLGLQQLLLEAARANGYNGMYFRDDPAGVLRAAFPPVQARFSPADVSGIMSNVANKFLLDGFGTEEDAWRKIAAIRSVTDFKTRTSYRMTSAFEFDEVGPTGELKHGEIGEESYTNRAKTHGKMFAITREDLYNDDLGALTDLPRRIGRGGHRKLNKVFWSEFLDNATFFSVGHNNYKAGTDTVLSLVGLELAELMFLDQTDADGGPLGVDPKILLVPNALKATGRRYMVSAKLGAENDEPEDNIYAGAFELVASRYLGNAAMAGSSTKAWYLLADPNDLATIEVCFLNGQQVPTVESADADFNVLGIQFRGYFDFGVAKQDYRGGVKMKGEASNS